MKKVFLTVLFLFLAGSVFAQEYIINSFDEAEADTNYWLFFENDNAVSDSSFIHVSFPTDDVVEGSGAMRLDYMAHNNESWGGFVKLEHWTGDSTGVYDFSNYDSMSIWYNNIIPEDEPGRVHLRINLHDVSENGVGVYDVNDCEYYYSFHYILDDEPGWHQIKFPMSADPPDWDGNGFNLTGWSGITGNGTLDLDQIKGFSFEFSINGGGEGDAVGGSIILDKFFLTGAAPNPWLIFNGKTLDPALGQFTWGQSGLELVDGAGEDPATNAILWTQGDEWGNGWSGAGWNVSPAKDIAFRWDLDSLRFKAKVDEGTGPVRMQFESGDAEAKVGHTWQPIDDGAWHEYALALKDFVVVDDLPNFDPSNITVFQMMGEALTDGSGNGAAIAGKKIYYDFLWTGSPVIDVVAPEPPGLVTASPSNYANLVTWADVPGEDGETYNVYYSESPITDLEADGVETVQRGVAENTQLATHVLRAPEEDQEVTYYYAVVCVDASSNESELAQTSAALTNTAKGVTIIHLGTPPNFAADGDLSEWSELAPFRMAPSLGDNFVVTNTSIDDDDDLSVDAYVAMDEDYMYMAFDVQDDIVVNDTTISTWLTDGCDIFIGLYDWRGLPHTSYKRGAEPDYHWRFVTNGLKADNPGGDDLAKVGDGNYFYKEKFPTGYIYEARLSWEEIAAIAGDSVFSPQNGMRVRIDYSINDADESGNRDDGGGIMQYSPNNEDQSWADVSRWSYTWLIGDPTDAEEFDLTPYKFELSQNYPNPFNPATLIQYSIPELSDVTVKVFNVLGQEVALLVNEVQSPGVYKVNFNASNLSTGVYMYRIQAGDFVAVKKMMLIK
jgi:hypothetical protein